jgi:hypothetical protein
MKRRPIIQFCHSETQKFCSKFIFHTIYRGHKKESKLTQSVPPSSQMGIWCPPSVWIGLKKPYCQKRRYFCSCNPLPQVIVNYCHWKVDFIVEKKRLNKKLPRVLKIITCIFYVPWTQIITGASWNTNET